MNTDDFLTIQLLNEKFALMLLMLTNSNAIEIEYIAAFLGNKRKLFIAIEVTIGGWIVFYVSLQELKLENDCWNIRQVLVVKLKIRSTMHERVFAEQYGVNRDKVSNLTEETNPIHNWALSMIRNVSFQEILIISRVLKVEDQLFAVKGRTEFLSQKGEEL